ncbi:hypothetical protein F5Y06DRAFT_255379 [Hypoxylon sp. FL0890]|nr:hypothetical protein F5Y06DRAFT_255379 [Hypoxylon sp. FL0890]
MPAEVISLLSSSPAATSPPILATSPEVSSRRTQAAPSRALDYGVLNLTAESSSETANRPSGGVSREPITGVKRSSSSYKRQDNDFLFLSDDFDTTGDLDGNVAKKARTSTSTAAPKKRDENGFNRTQSAAASTKDRKPRSPLALKRWNSVVDPIEHSSSPNGFASRKISGKPHNSSDPFDSPPKRQATTNAKLSRPDLTSDPFRSSPGPLAGDRGPSTDSKVKQQSYNNPSDSLERKGSSKAPVVIDLSDDEFEGAPGKYQAKKSKQNAAWDPISSSMPEAKTVNILDDSESDDLPELSDIDFSKLNARRRCYSLTPSPPRKKPTAAAKRAVAKKAAEPKKTGEEKEQEKRKKAEAREAEKERKRIEKERAKEQRAVEKQKEKALAEVNKLKTDRKVAVPEMIVDLSSTLNVGVKAQIEKLLGEMDVQFEYWESRIDNVVKWRRKVTSKYNEELELWEPIPMHIRPEEHVMVIVEAAEFVKLVLGPEGQDLEAHVLKMKTNHPNNTLIYLIEGLIPWMRKNKNIQNRRFASAVRALDVNNDGSAVPSSQRRRNNNAQQEYIDEDIVEDALLSLQVVHGAFIHHTNLQVETAQWVAVFTQHISTIPYRRARDAAADAGFCMEAGQVRTGEDAKDTYVRMLQEVTRVTAPIAYGIAAKYGTVSELVRGLEREGPLALENCRKCANRDGAFTDRVIGPAVSKRIYKIFTSRDPGSMDV